MKKVNGICAVCGKSFKCLVQHLQSHQAKSTTTFLCSKCPKSFTTKSARKRHDESRHMGIKPNLTRKSCAICGRLAGSKFDLARHIQSIHSGTREFKCDQCPLSFKLESGLATHKRRHSDDKPFACQRCSSRFYTKVELQVHAITHSEEKMFRCKTCGKRLTSPRGLAVHVRIHLQDFRYFCVNCPAKFTDSSACNRHAKVHIGRRDFACPHCSASFLNKSILGKHVHVHDAENASAYTCKLCKVGFSNEADLERHTTAIHANSKPEPVHRKQNFFPKSNLPDSHRCPICALMFPTRFARDRHLGSHSKSATGRFRCAVCQGKFDCRRALLIHLLRHRGQTDNFGEFRAGKNFPPSKSNGEIQCAICAGTFADRSTLAKHLRRQPGRCCQKAKLLQSKMKFFKCEFCTAKCTSRNFLEIHRRTHTDEKPYACARCPYKYAQKGNLIAHLRKHYRVHMFACKMCLQTFFSKSQLDSHLLTHGGVGVVRFGCAICNSYHGLRSSLISHLTMRHRIGPRPFACDVCPKRFLTQKRLAKHYAKKAHTWLLRNI